MAGGKIAWRRRLRALAAVALAIAAPAAARESSETVTVAVAANFAAPMRALAAEFEAGTGHRVRIVSGSTGKHYAQILNGAPFDVFFAADAERPRKLVEAELAVPGTLTTYAHGRLVLWSSDPGLVDGQGRVLASGGFRRLAIANPRLAPYGRAAREVLANRLSGGQLAGRLVEGESVAQAFQFVASGNAELGLVALSQVRDVEDRIAGSSWLVPAELHRPIEQQAVLLSRSNAVREFFEFVSSPAARDVIRSYGYETP